MVCWKKVAIMPEKENVKYSIHINEQRQGKLKKMSQCILGVIKTASTEQLVTGGEGVNSLLGRATGREKIKNKDQAPAGSGRNPALASLLSPNQVLLLLSPFHPWSAQKREEGQQKQLYHNKAFQAFPAQRKEARGSQKSYGVGGSGMNQIVGGRLSRFSAAAPRSPGSPVPG